VFTVCESVSLHHGYTTRIEVEHCTTGLSPLDLKKPCHHVKIQVRHAMEYPPLAWIGTATKSKGWNLITGWWDFLIPQQ